jgi:hypothetical protein
MHVTNNTRVLLGRRRAGGTISAPFFQGILHIFQSPSFKVDHWGPQDLRIFLSAVSASKNCYVLSFLILKAPAGI